MSDHRSKSVIAIRGRRRQRLAPQANRAHLDAQQFVALGIGLTGALRGNRAMAASRTTYKKYQSMNPCLATGTSKPASPGISITGKPKMGPRAVGAGHVKAGLRARHAGSGPGVGTRTTQAGQAGRNGT